MKLHGLDLPIGKYPPPTTQKKFLMLAYALLLVTLICLFLNTSSSPWPSLQRSISNLRGTEPSKSCNVFKGNWVPHPNGTYYTNTTCNLIIDQQNCLKFGRPDTEFLKWRWKPDECELPLFDAIQFLELVRGKSMAFLGDSVGRNQMQSLLCLLSSVSTQSVIRFSRFFIYICMC